MFSGSMINLFCVKCKHPIHEEECEIMIADEPELLCGCGEEDEEYFYTCASCDPHAAHGSKRIGDTDVAPCPEEKCECVDWMHNCDPENKCVDEDLRRMGLRE